MGLDWTGCGCICIDLDSPSSAAFLFWWLEERDDGLNFSNSNVNKYSPVALAQADMNFFPDPWLLWNIRRPVDHTGYLCIINGLIVRGIQSTYKPFVGRDRQLEPSASAWISLIHGTWLNMVDSLPS